MFVGVDEVGRGAWAGPMVLAAVRMKKGGFRSKMKVAVSNSGATFWLVDSGVKIGDSKLLKSSEREAADLWIREYAEMVIVEVGLERLRDMGLRKAWEWGVVQVLTDIEPTSEVIVDGSWGVTGERFKVMPMVKADQKIFEVACASIVAKVYRDSLMQELGLPETEVYQWKVNKGYGTQGHRNAVLAHGVCQFHRIEWVNAWLAKHV